MNEIPNCCGIQKQMLGVKRRMSHSLDVEENSLQVDVCPANQRALYSFGGELTGNDRRKTNEQNTLRFSQSVSGEQNCILEREHNKMSRSREADFLFRHSMIPDTELGKKETSYAPRVKGKKQRTHFGQLNFENCSLQICNLNDRHGKKILVEYNSGLHISDSNRRKPGDLHDPMASQSDGLNVPLSILLDGNEVYDLGVPCGEQYSMLGYGEDASASREGVVPD